MRIFDPLFGRAAPSSSPLPDVALPLVEGIRLEEIASQSALNDGWRRVAANQGGPGPDGVTIEDFATDATTRITDLSQALISGSYLPGRLRRAGIPKPSGGKRLLAIPNVVDRVAQTAAWNVLCDALDERMSNVSWGYRPGRGVREALAMARANRAEGFVWTVDADIWKYFDRVPHRRLTEELTIWVDDERVVGLFMKWLRSFSGYGRGIAQGSPISPLLANLYLHPIDRLLVTEGYRVVRYADDLLVQARTEVEAGQAYILLESLLRRRGLQIHDEKTRIVKPTAPLQFLGETVGAAPADAA